MSLIEQKNFNKEENMNIWKRFISNLIFKIDLTNPRNLYDAKILEQINRLVEMYKFILKIITTLIGITQLQLLFYFAFVEKIIPSKTKPKFGFEPLSPEVNHYPQWIDNFFQIAVIMGAIFLCLAFIIIIIYIISKRYSIQYAVESELKMIEETTRKQQDEERTKILNMLDEELIKAGEKITKVF